MNKLLWILGIFLLLTQHLYADSYGPPSDHSMEYYNEFQVVFEGKPIAIKEHSNQYLIVVFEVEKAYRGVSEGERLEVYSINPNPQPYPNATDAHARESIEFLTNEPYLVFAFQEEDFILTNKSAGTKLISAYEEEDRERARFFERIRLKAEYEDRTLPPKTITEYKYVSKYQLVFQANGHKGEYAQYRNAVGIVTAEGRLQDGIPVGEWIYYNPKGVLKAKGCYEHGVKDGVWVEYPFVTASSTNKSRMWKRKYERGRELEFIEYEEGKLLYKTVFLPLKKQIDVECTVFHGKFFNRYCKCGYQEGYRLSYYLTGEKKEERIEKRLDCEDIETMYIQEAVQTEVKEYYPSQIIKSEGIYVKELNDAYPQKVGIWKFYNSKGRLIRTENN